MVTDSINISVKIIALIYTIISILDISLSNYILTIWIHIIILISI